MILLFDCYEIQLSNDTKTTLLGFALYFRRNPQKHKKHFEMSSFEISNKPSIHLYLSYTYNYTQILDQNSRQTTRGFSCLPTFSRKSLEKYFLCQRIYRRIFFGRFANEPIEAIGNKTWYTFLYLVFNISFFEWKTFAPSHMRNDTCAPDFEHSIFAHRNLCPNICAL